MIRTLYFICIIFVKIYNYILDDINSEPSRVIFFLYLSSASNIFVPHFCNFVTIRSTVLNNNNNNEKKNIYIHLYFGLSKLYTNIQQDQKAKLDYHTSMLFAYMAEGEGVGG